MRPSTRLVYLRPLVLAALLPGAAGCPIHRIREEPRVVDREVSTYTTEVPTQHRHATVSISATIERGKPVIPVRIGGAWEAVCISTQHRVIDRTVITERTVEDRPGWFAALGYASGIAGVAALATGVAILATHEHEGPEDVVDDTESAGNALAALGGLGAVYGGIHLSYDLLAIDSERHEGKKTYHDAPEERLCARQPAAGAVVSVQTPEGEPLLRGTLDASGALEATVTRDDVMRLGPDYEVLLDGRPAGPTTVFAPVHQVTRIVR